MKSYFSVLFVISFVIFGKPVNAQCNWTQVYYESYEYSSVITPLLPGTTYQNTPQTYAGCVRTGNSGMYMNIVDGYLGLLYQQTFNNLCSTQSYRFSFSTRDAWTSTNNLTVRVKDNNGNVLVTQNVINGSAWNDIVMMNFTTPTPTITFEIITNAVGTGGNDVGFDDLRLFQCQPNSYNISTSECAATTTLNLFDEISGSTLSTNGTWTGPSVLSNGYQGTFVAGTNTNGIYHYAISNGLGCADSVANIQFASIQTPVLNSVSDITTCTNYPLPQIAGSNLSGNQKYYTGSGGTGTSYLPGYVVNSTQTIYIHDGLPGCEDEVSFTVTIVPAPVITVSAYDTICLGENSVLTALSSTPNMTYTWSPGALIGNPITVSPTSSTVYTVTGTNSIGCVSNLKTTVVTVRPKPVLTVQSSSDTLCEGEQAQLMVQSTLNNTQYAWEDGTNNAMRIVSPTQTSTYTVIGQTANGCKDTVSINVEVIPALQVSINGQADFCEGGNTVLSAIGNNLNMTFEWLPSQIFALSIGVNEFQTGWIILNGSYHNCPVAVDSLLVTALPNPSISVPDDFLVCPGEPVVATVNSSSSSSVFHWMPGSLTGESNTLVSNGSAVYYVYAQDGACISQVDSFLVDMSMDCYVELPNVFTPNGDQTNDFFQLTAYDGIKSLSISIVNRWGNQIVYFDIPNFQWNGKDELGKAVSEGVYFYTMTVTLNSDEERTKNGFVHLQR